MSLDQFSNEGLSLQNWRSTIEYMPARRMFEMALSANLTCHEHERAHHRHRLFLVCDALT